MFEKRKPIWLPANIEDLLLADIKTEYFVKKSPEILSLLNHSDHAEYPHRHVALPNRADVQQHLSAQKASMPTNSSTINDILDRFIRKKNSWLFVRERVEKILNRYQIANSSQYIL
jgi:hypothetical protein